MSQQATTEPTLDLDQYRQNTQDLLASMEETTALVGEMSENMRRLGECFESFGETKHQLRDAREEMNRPDATTGPATTPHAAD